MIEGEELKRILAELAQQTLDSTDWYVVREMETGKPIPQDIRAAREQARVELSNAE